jgi:hypothetical protein
LDGSRWAYDLQRKQNRYGSPRRYVCGQDLERREAGRSPCGAADKVRIYHQSKSGEADRPHDPADPIQVEWAIATRVQPHRDIEILTELPGIILDPSLPRGEERPLLTSKMTIDATRYDPKNFAPVCLPAAEVMSNVEHNWSRYGIPSR